ncbi:MULTISPECIES: polysaccharide deacetylase family protein [Halorhodospira]|uniref:polysaccharide deacetylase family protein n=1 Tax=Halorhodospira TaxID=85108 RepID=UPI001911424B|nr:MULTISPECIES: polysaccharide deacetylase family protein [Halorhodospira]MBK5936378.1 hypothetical protein [Halorhodospira halophila]MBK5943533.1 hypothetical protein [Halorhodospira halophila]MCG5527063.1 polysaccharide deacetylase family protein [Halorhodospira halophila]MCG5542600.1 polysaccharide deacetylase family protein [Halorhodospira sp. 9628]
MHARTWLPLGITLAALTAGGSSHALGQQPPEKDPQAEPRGSAVVFMYHRFGEDRYPSTSVRLEQFEAQLDYLEEEDFNVWPVEWVIDVLRHGGELPERTVSITVDDAYASVYEEAFPRLKERDWPMTVFVATDDVDSGRSAYMDWEQMREMRDSGLVRFANHSSSHDYLVRRDDEEDDEAWRARMREDVDNAQQRLQEELGEDVNTDPKLYAYPFGEYNPELADLLRDKGYTAFGQHSGAIGTLSDKRALPRFAVNEQFGDMEDFELRANSLPLPVESMEPFDPLLDADNNPPRMEIQLAEDHDVGAGRLNCFASGQGAMEVEWLDDEQTRFAVQAEEPFGKGRARYNCTAPHRDGSGRFFWFSKQWLNP